MRGDKHRKQLISKLIAKFRKHIDRRRGQRGERGRQMGFSRKHAELSAAQLKKAKELLQLRFIIDAVNNIPEFSSQLSTAQLNGLVDAVNIAVDEIKLQTPAVGPPSGLGAQKRFLFADPGGNQIIRYTLSADALELDSLQEEIDALNQQILDLSNLPVLTDEFIINQAQIKIDAGESPGIVAQHIQDLVQTQTGPISQIVPLTTQRDSLLALQSELLTKTSIVDNTSQPK